MFSLDLESRLLQVKTGRGVKTHSPISSVTLPRPEKTKKKF